MARGLRAVLAAVAVALAGCTTTTTAPPAPSSLPSPATATASPSDAVLQQVHDPGQLTGTLTGPCHYGGGGQLPDPRCTPGAYDPQITAAILCAPGYTTRGYRPPEAQTSAFKFHVAYPAYGVAAVPGAPSELDHLVSLELGGSNSASNLWVEMGPIPNPKDAVENALHAWVCAATGSGAETRLHEAQAAIAADWLTAEKTLGIGS